MAHTKVTEPSMLPVPDDVMVDILLRLPVRAVCRFSAASKSCRAVASKPAFLRAYTSRAAAAALPVILSWASTIVPVPAPCYSNYKEDHPLHRRPFGHGYIAGGYSHPVTGIFHLLHCTMSYVASTAKCTLYFQILAVDGNSSSPSSWREIPVSVDIDRSTHMWVNVGRGRCISSATVNGRLHWWPMLDDGKKLLVFDTEKEAFGSMPLPELGSTYGSKLKQQAISTLSGKLCLLAGYASGMVEVWVLQDYHRGRWQLRQILHAREDAAPLGLPVQLSWQCRAYQGGLPWSCGEDGVLRLDQGSL
ncbi:hypothetical protein QOZ80_2BG0182320 [Eleusine coracana subsp. coracana]|nr:hypothetical protein QOZ80_2BG0182320 [Eleusine coracana subsp. coracana]